MLEFGVSFVGRFDLFRSVLYRRFHYNVYGRSDIVISSGMSLIKSPAMCSIS